MSANKASMPEELNNGVFSDDDYEEIWVVILNTKGEYKLSKNQGRLVREAMARGERGAIVFETFAISIPYIAEFYRESRFLKKSKQLPARATEALHKPILAERMQEIRKQVYQKIGKPMPKDK